MLHNDKDYRSTSFVYKSSIPIELIVNLDQQWRHTSKMRTSPSAKIGTSLRSYQSKELLSRPGPGSYNLNGSFFERGNSANKVNNKNRLNTDTSGKKTTKTQNIFSEKKLSFLKNQSQQKINIHNFVAKHKNEGTDKIHGITFAKKQREPIVSKEKEKYPGPGNYKEKTLTRNQYSFHKAKKFSQQDHESAEKEKMPGPGAYDVSLSRITIKNGKFAQAMRKILQNDNNPGVGTYKTEKTSLKHEGGAVSKQKKLFKYETQSPGPAKYEIISIDKIKTKCSVTVINKSENYCLDSHQKNPGPGDYFKDKDSLRSTKILGGVIGHQSRILTKRTQSPGPVNYSPSYRDIFSKPTSVIIGRQKRMKTTESNQIEYFDKIKRIKSGKKSRVGFEQIEQMSITLHGNFRQRDRDINVTTLSHK